MKTFYQLLSVEVTASAEDVKQAFRREIARYHPDKVQHLGHEFEEFATTRASQLTEAYRVLMDPNLRKQYDEGLEPGDTTTTPPTSSNTSSGDGRDVAAQAARASRGAADRAERSAPIRDTFRHARASVSEVVRTATLARLRDAVYAESSDAAQVSVMGFDAAFAIKPRRGLFKKSGDGVVLLVKIVERVDGESIEEAWRLALKTPTSESPVCLLLLGSGLASSRDLGASVAAMRRRSRAIGPIVVPVDVRDWQALFPPDAPAACRSVIDRLKLAG